MALELRVGDILLTALAALGAVYLAAFGRWAPDVWMAVGTFAVIAVGPPVLRALAARYQGVKALDFAASMWLLPAAIFGHFALAPLLDVAHPRLLDRYLALVDLRLFGTHPAVVLTGWVRGPALDALFVCYYCYFALPFVVGVLLYFRDRARFEELITALTVLFAANFIFYLLVPAVGPRYFLAGEFSGPLQGGLLTAWLDSLMRQPAFAADCFPSGHTAVTLVSMAFAYRYSRKLFWGFFPIAAGLIAATVVCRFHYGIDILCALPLAGGCLALAWQTAHPTERLWRVPGRFGREPARA